MLLIQSGMMSVGVLFGLTNFPLSVELFSVIVFDDCHLLLDKGHDFFLENCAFMSIEASLYKCQASMIFTSVECVCMNI